MRCLHSQIRWLVACKCLNISAVSSQCAKRQPSRNCIWFLSKRISKCNDLPTTLHSLGDLSCNLSYYTWTLADCTALHVLQRCYTEPAFDRMCNLPLPSLVVVSVLRLQTRLCKTWSCTEDSDNDRCFFNNPHSSHRTSGTRKWDIEVGKKLFVSTSCSKQLQDL